MANPLGKKLGALELTPKQIRLVEEYLVVGEGKQAAINAGYSPTSATEIASNTLRLPKVQKYIEEMYQEKAVRAGISVERILKELARIAFANVKDIVSIDSDGNTTVDLEKLDREMAASMTEVAIVTSTGKTKSQTIRVKNADKIAALTLIGKHLGMFKEKVEVSGSVSLAELVEASLRPIEEKSPEESESLH